ncbi:uncharacterized protein LOC117167847 [Belonocnema kinseyi]|uniref:uncharacterized protein LOC117167847 n=1 Tax=Belonocnema kinseyi TaxID=2817044 RepID=UPI00143DEE5C|nr:uncharacterized protein LOC117167847 [Belonocnema kinseyi]
MTSRNPRTRLGANSGAGARGPCRPGLTRTQTMRQAKTSVAARERIREESPVRDVGPCPSRREKIGLSKLGPPPAAAKRIDFTKPGLTKAMMARLQHAQKRLEAEQKKRQEEASASRRPRRTAAPIGGDARVGRERLPPRKWHPEGALQEAAMRSPTVRKMMQGREHQARGALAERNGTQRSVPTTTIPKITATVANRSIQVIRETLDEQDVIEAEAVQNKLQDLQQARREFVLSVANVSGNLVNIADEVAPSFSQPEPSHRYLHKIPDINDPIFQVEYDRCHPSVAAAREFLKRTQAAQAQREAQRRIDEEFARAAATLDDEDLRFDIPLDHDIMEGDISFEEDEDGTIIPCLSRIRASMPPIPQRSDSYYSYRPNDIDELERFFDTTTYPPVASTFVPPGRENINSDLWELEDPWYRECPQPDVPDMIEFDMMEH